MIATTLDLTVELRCADGTSTEFYQTDEECIRKTLHSLATPRLLMQPELTLASEYAVNTIPCRSIDMILAHTSARAPRIFPLIFPAGLLDIAEVPNELSEDDSAANEDGSNDGPAWLSPLVSNVEIHTRGGWSVAIKILAMARAIVPHQPRQFVDFSELPVFPFRLRDGGIGLINPHNLTRVSALLPSGARPEKALSMDSLRWTTHRV